METMGNVIEEILDDLAVDVDYDTCTAMVTAGHIGSLTMIALVAALEDAFDVTIPTVEVVARNFDSVGAIEGLVTRLRAEDRL
jgi:acyl carrier protein